MSGNGAPVGIPTARSIDHFALTVPDLDQAIDFFVDYLGAEFIYRVGPIKDDGTWMKDALNVDARASTEIAMLRLGEHTNLELFVYTTADQSMTPPRNSDVGGSHIAFYVDDIQRAYDYLETIDGVVMQLGPNDVQDGTEVDGVNFCYFLTPWGQQMEIISTPNGMGYERQTAARMAPPSPRWRA